MTDTTITLIGASGWLGRALGPALLRRRLIRQENLICANRSGPSPAYAGWPGLRWETVPVRAVEGAQAVVLSLRPDEFRAADIPCAGRLVLSFMAGVSCAEIRARTGARAVIRAMPNAAMEIGRSYTPWYAAPEATAADLRLTEGIIGACGHGDALENEDQLLVLTALSGAGPAYAALMAQALLEAAEAAGLPSGVARAAVEAVVCDAPALLSGRIGEAGAMVKEFVEYRGTTAAALSAAQEAGFAEALRAALAAGAAKARAMAG